MVTALDQKLQHFAVCMKEEVIKKLVVMVSTAFFVSTLVD